MKTAELLEKVSSGEIDWKDASDMLEHCEDAKRRGPAIHYKVSEKGAVSAYGLQKGWPVTLYAGQWERLDADDERERRRKFIVEHADELSRKGDKKEPVKAKGKKSGKAA